MAFVSRIDCAAAAYAVLTQDGHAGMTYDITGPASVSYGDVAALLTEVLGRPIGFRGIDDAEMAARFRSAGVPEEMVEPRVALGRAIRGGFFSAVSPTVEELTGRAGVPVRSVLETHRDTLAAIVAAAA
jgi:NAD(P)H dehydrogenase (quinone)